MRASSLAWDPTSKALLSPRSPDSSPAAEAGLKRGDVIEQVNQQPVNSVADYQRLIRQAGKESLLLLINRGGATTFMVVQPM